MPPNPPPTGLVALLEEQADACRRGDSPMYAALLARAAADVRADGLVAQVLAPYAAAPVDAAVPLRFMGALHRLVLERAAPELAVHYPSVGGTFVGVDAAWPAVLETLERHRDRVAALLERVPQTNEVGRAAALAGLLRYAVARTGRHRVRLVEIGASAGLNLLVDSYRVTGDVGAPWGPADSPVRLADGWLGGPPPDGAVEIVSREGVDRDPVDPRTTEGRLHLTAYVWADQRERLERLRGALEVAAAAGPSPVRRGSASEALGALEAHPPNPDELLVVWHSVVWQYLSDGERQRVRDRLVALGRAAGAVHAALEPVRLLSELPSGSAEAMAELTARGARHAVTLRVADGPLEVLGTAPAHGVPVRWEREERSDLRVLTGARRGEERTST